MVFASNFDYSKFYFNCFFSYFDCLLLGDIWLCISVFLLFFILDLLFFLFELRFPVCVSMFEWMQFLLNDVMVFESMNWLMLSDLMMFESMSWLTEFVEGADTTHNSSNKLPFWVYRCLWGGGFIDDGSWSGKSQIYCKEFWGRMRIRGCWKVLNLMRIRYSFVRCIFCTETIFYWIVDDNWFLKDEDKVWSWWCIVGEVF